MEISLFLIFLYGILHAMGPDHLTAIADLSIGKNIKKTAWITFLFALGHGLTLFIFAKLLLMLPFIEDYTAYGDKISSSVIILMGLFLLYMVWADRIRLDKHSHQGQEHIHISFSKMHQHNARAGLMPAFGLAALMGIGGVRGMLITLGVVGHQEVSFTLVTAFVLGVSLVFMAFGLFILWINRYLLTSLTNVRRIFSVLGLTSVGVGTHMLLG